MGIARLDLIDMSDYNPGARVYWWTTASAGLAVTVWAFDRVARMESPEQLIVAVMIGLVILSSLKSTPVPGTQVVIAPGDVFVFLAAILQGPAAATLVAVAEALCISFRTSHRWTSRLGGPALMAISISASAALFATTVDWLRENALLSSGALIGALLAFSIVYFLLNSVFLAAHQALKLRKGLFSLWRENYSWAWLTYVASAATAGLVQLAILQIGMAALLAAIPLIAVIYVTSHLHFKQAEERLRASERMGLILNNTSDVVFAFNLKGRITYVNPAIESLTGYTIQEISELEFLSLVHADDNLRLSTVWDLLVAGQRRTEEEFRLETKTGKTKWCSGSWGPIYDERRRQVGVQGNLRDISEHKMLKAQLLHSQKMEAIGRLAGGIAHDFNNLLTAIVGYSQLSLAGLDKANPVYERITEVLKAAERAGLLTRQLLAFSRKQVLVPELVDLNALLKDISEMLRRLICENNTELIAILSPRLGQVRADPGQIGQVIVNLAVNARDAMPNGGSITMQTANMHVGDAEVIPKAHLAPGDYVMLTVTDTGSGMDGETMSQMFEPFFTTKAMGKGTGLGLSTVYGIVKQSGGEITVESERGRGTTFRIYLPMVVDAPAALSLEDVLAADSGTETILIVEDDETLLELASEILAHAGYNALRAPGGESALSQCEGHKESIDLMITDLVMPRMNGSELARCVALLRPEMRIMFMSGYAGDAVTPEAISVAGMPFLQKPFTPEALCRKVREVLDSGQQLTAGSRS